MAEGTGECAVENMFCAPSVQAIDHKSVHQICSGQVILNLATAVKELVENSLDAEAKIIDVKLKEHGAEVVEVIDDGCGVKPENFAALTLKHFTSKLRDFSDLASVETFGFRGEALSSLCALSDLSITTRHNSENVGTKLEYDHNGKILTRTPCAREHGTTVTLHNLFVTLPVRHKEFLRNIKKEYCKLLQVLHAYCIISSGVRISCSNQLEKGRRSLLVATNGSLNLKENISCVFGPKQTQNLLAFQQVEPSEEECEIYGLQQEEMKSKTTIFQISGYVSKAEHGMGRSSADRQFFYINKRPCDIVKVSRVVNEVYHMYNRHQYPFVVMDISLARDSVDVNVTPDKRQVFVQEEKLLLAIVKSSLKKMLEPGSSTYAVNQGLQSKEKRESPALLAQNMHRLGKSLKEINVSVKDEKPDSAKVHNALFPPLASFKRKCGLSDVGCDIQRSEPRSKQPKLTAIFGPSTTKKELNEDNISQNFKDYSWIQDPSTRCGGNEERVPDKEDGQSTVLHSKSNRHIETSRNDADKLDFAETLTETAEEDLTLKEYNNKSLQNKAADVLKFSTVIDSVGKNEKKNEVYVGSKTKDTANCGSHSYADPKITTESYRTKYENQNLPKIVTTRRSVDIDFNMNEIQNFFKASCRQSNTHDKTARLFRAKISPENNQVAEEELKKHVTKEMFDKMEILGQFNLGFIITKLEDDLFLIDQHASDEKFNFEDLQRNSELKCQKLIHPLQLELTAVNESILLENLEVFHKNGFDFIIDEEAAPMKRIKLASLPTNKNWTFGVEDIEELIFMLSDSPGTMCRPSRVRKMFASRACRMSIMVGTALDHRKMKHVISHMGQMDQPWNCPHGRPTMRHLINLRMISTPE